MAEFTIGGARNVAFGPARDGLTWWLGEWEGWHLYGLAAWRDSTSHALGTIRRPMPGGLRVRRWGDAADDLHVSFDNVLFAHALREIPAFAEAHRRAVELGLVPAALARPIKPREFFPPMPALTKHSTVRDLCNRLRDCRTAADVALVLDELRRFSACPEANALYVIGCMGPPGSEGERLKGLLLEASPDLGR